MAGVLGPVLDSLIQDCSKEHEHTRATAAKSHKGDEGLGVCELYGEAERTWIVQHGEEKAQRDLIHVYLMGGIKMMESDSSEWCPMTDQEAIGTN